MTTLANNDKMEKINILAAGTKNAGTSDSASNYYSYLQKNCDCMSKGNVISSKYLQHCAGDTEKAKELEVF